MPELLIRKIALDGRYAEGSEYDYEEAWRGPSHHDVSKVHESINSLLKENGYVLMIDGVELLPHLKDEIPSPSGPTTCFLVDGCLVSNVMVSGLSGMRQEVHVAGDLRSTRTIDTIVRTIKQRSYLSEWWVEKEMRHLNIQANRPEVQMAQILHLEHA